MGTNYYLMTSKREYRGKLGDNCELIDDPYFGYSLHIMKNSCGWLPLFQFHRGIIHSVSDIKQLYDTGDFEIRNEYGDLLTWDEYFEIFETKYDLYRKGERKMVESHLDNKYRSYSIRYFTDSRGYEFTDQEFS